MHHSRLILERSGFTMIELMIVIAIIGLLAAIAIPNFIAYRNKAYCTQAETDADHVAGAIADYFGTGSRTNTPALDDLKVNVLNSVDIIGADPNLHITIQVTDVSRRCPSEYQSGHPGWDGNNIFIKEIR
jgi:prepilin-type N-terminal cleavage/methylation domain-containing protein